MEMYNLPTDVLETGRDVFWSVVAKHFGKKEISVLEIGVFQGKCFAELLKSKEKIKISSYTGVDPYLGEVGDPYLGSYWNSNSESTSIYLSSKALFEENGQAGGVLIRKTSEEFYSSSEKKYDFIYVDGNHTYKEALWDMTKWFSRLNDGGLLMVDDYANISDVTKAVNSFVALCSSDIGRYGFFDKSFINSRKYIPAISRYVYFEKTRKDYSNNFSINNGSSARNGVPKKINLKKELAIWGCSYATKLVIDMVGDNVKYVISDNFEKEFYGKEIIRFEESIKKDLFYIIPSRGTKNIEDQLIENGKIMSEDFFTLYFPEDVK